MQRYPFPYFGEGSARPIRAKDGLLSLVVFASPITPATAKTIAATAPKAMQAFVENGQRWMSFETTGAPPSAKAMTAWIEGVHRAHPVSLFFVGSDGKRGAWHADTVARFGERVRPVVEALRQEGASDHADWILRSFLSEGAPTSFEDVRALAEDDPPEHVGDIGARYRLARPLVDALGPSSLAALGPYGELGFWASAPIAGLVPDPRAHARHLVALADACPKKRWRAVQLLLVLAARRMAHDVDAMLVIAQRAASTSPLTIGMLEMLVDDARKAGGAARAIAIAEPFFARTLATVRRDPRDRAEEEDSARLAAMTAQLEIDVRSAPNATLAALLADAPKPPVDEEGDRDDATHPHLARLNAERLTVCYRGSAEPGHVRIEITGSPRAGRAKHYRDRVQTVVELIELGFGGGAMFPPELGAAELVEGTPANDPGRDFQFTLRVRAVDPAFWAIALHHLAYPWDQVDIMRAVKDCPKHVSIVSELPVDDSEASATTARVLDWLRDPTPAFRAYPAPPFTVKDDTSSKTVCVLKPVQMQKKLGERVQRVVYALPRVLTAHPDAARAMLVSKPDVGKTQVKVSWFKGPPPSKVTRGPILNMARRLHCEITPLSVVTLANGGA